MTNFERVLARRSMCRDFDAAPLSGECLDRVLAAAFRGPSAGNTAGLDLVVLEHAAVEQYWSITLPEPRRSAFAWPGLLRAPVLVIPYVDPDAYVERYARPDKAASGLGDDHGDWPVPYWFVDGGAAVMAMLLAAEAEGLGALLFGQFAHEATVAQHFGVPGARRAVGTVALGWPAPGGRQPSRSARSGRPEPGRHLHHGRWSAP